MKNTYFKYNDIELKDNIYVKNYSSMLQLKKLNQEIIDKNTLYHKVEDHDLIESISFKLWGVEDYWDILMAINGIKNMYELPVSFDEVYDRAMIEYNKRLEIVEYSSNKLSDSDKNILFSEILENEEIKNEKFRNLKYVSTAVLSDLLNDLTIKTDIEINAINLEGI